jgi:dephospho-CoA kinase
MYLIGVVGQNGAGKSSFVQQLKILSNNGIEVYKFSDLLSQTLGIWGIEKSRRNLQELPRVMEIGFGTGILSQATKRQIEKSQAQIIILDGVRWQTDYELVRSFRHNLLVSISANPQSRYDRLKTRGEKVSEHIMTRQQFDEEEQALSELQIPDISQQADVQLINDGSVDQFAASVVTFYRQYLLDSSIAN